jgi:hypothetical protein
MSLLALPFAHRRPHSYIREAAVQLSILIPAFAGTTN